MAYNDSLATNTFFAMWKEYFYKYFKQTNGWDQVSLRISLWRSNVRIHGKFTYKLDELEKFEKVIIEQGVKY